jgi:ketosteroid isomerase-like protein
VSEPQETVRDFFQRMADRPESALALLAPDAVWTTMGTTPLSGTYRGAAAFAEGLLAPFAELANGYKLVVDEIFGEGERVAALAHGEGGDTRTGVPYRNHYAFVMRVRSGRITEVVEYMDTVMVETALYGRQLVEAR